MTWLRRRSPWQRVIDRCPQRLAHLGHAFDRLDYLFEIGGRGAFEFGVEAVVACLEHTFGLSEEDVADLRWQISVERDDPDFLELTTYRGGSPRLPDDPDRDGNWTSTVDLHPMIEARAQELENPDANCGPVFWFEIDEEYDSWTATLDCMRIGDYGWLTTDYMNDNENYVTALLGYWTPFDDPDARRRAIITSYAWETGGFPPLHRGVFDGELDLLVDCLVKLCAPSEGISDFGWEQIKRVVVGNSHLGSEVSIAAWNRLGVTPPEVAWWSGVSADDAERHRQDPEYMRPFVGLYVALHMRQE